MYVYIYYTLAFVDCMSLHSVQGCRLRNTSWIYGLVVYAGHDTKLVQNSGQTKFKRTHLDLLINKLVIFVSSDGSQPRIYSVYFCDCV